ncbi:MAG: glycosyltransferase [Elusimicrobia bacterium]|nr:glycosyltransferase [Elusimicrobiota bacterium]
MTPGLVSVVVTSYNHAQYLPQRMESLLAQTYRPLEIIVVDDASTDGSAKVLFRWEGDPRVKLVVLGVNGGAAAASNTGAALASGEYLMFAECDDFDRPEHIARLVAALKASSAGVAFCRSELVDARGAALGDDFENREPAFRALCAKDALIPRRLMQRFLLRACVVPNMSAALIRKAAFDAAGGVSSAYRLCLDWDLWGRLAKKDDFFYIAEPLSSFRAHGGTARSTVGLARQIEEIYSVLTAAAAGLELSASDHFKFRLGLARIWAGYLRENPARWLASLPSAWLASARFDPASLAYLGLAFAAKAAGYRGSLAEG